MDITGQYLKHEREKQQKSVQEMVSATRISKTVIEAIENDNYDALPPFQYLKGLLRLYANALDMNGDEVVAGYEKVFHGKKTSEFKILRGIEAARNEKKRSAGYFFIVFLILFLA